MERAKRIVGRNSQSETLVEKAHARFREAFERPCDDALLEGLRRAKAWSEETALLTSQSAALLTALRANVLEAQRICEAAEKLDPDPPDFDQVGWTRHLVNEWLEVVPDHPGAVSTAYWILATGDYTKSARYIHPTGPWGFWRRALTRWWRKDGGLYVDEDNTAPPIHAALRILAGFEPAGSISLSQSERWALTVRAVRDELRHENSRRKPEEQFRQELIETVNQAVSRGPKGRKKPT